MNALWYHITVVSRDLIHTSTQRQFVPSIDWTRFARGNPVVRPIHGLNAFRQGRLCRLGSVTEAYVFPPFPFSAVPFTGLRTGALYAEKSIVSMDGINDFVTNYANGSAGEESWKLRAQKTRKHHIAGSNRRFSGRYYADRLNWAGCIGPEDNGIWVGANLIMWIMCSFLGAGNKDISSSFSCSVPLVVSWAQLCTSPFYLGTNDIETLFNVSAAHLVHGKPASPSR